MPRKLELRLKRTAHARHYGADRTRRYVYGTLGKLKKLKPGRKGKR